MVRAAVVASALFSTAAIGQVPNYVHFMEVADGYADLLTTIQICPTFGYVIHAPEALAYRGRLVEEAAMGGMSPETALRMIDQAIEREGAAMRYLAETIPERDEAGMVEITDFLGDRCDRFAAHARWGEFVSAPADSMK